MLAKLVNEVTLSFQMRNDGPILINSPAGSKIDPTLPDMSFVRCKHNGVDTVYFPGSSIKGVFRSRYEQLMYALDKSVCELKPENYCLNNKKNSQSNGTDLYEKSCASCRLFGNLSLGSRVDFTDAYPVNNTLPTLGMRHGNAIERVTGAVKGKALFSIEVVEEGRFEFEIRVTNFALYQLRLLIWIIEDIDDGRVTFGMGGSRGNGQMRLINSAQVKMKYRLYDSNFDMNKLRGYKDKDLGGEVDYTEGLFGKELEVTGLNKILNSINLKTNTELQKAMGYELWV